MWLYVCFAILLLLAYPCIDAWHAGPDRWSDRTFLVVLPWTIAIVYTLIFVTIFLIETGIKALGN